ncbi:MAG TPA: hypothetical protein VFO77_14840 [Actinoplanes sp.]|nr:hypothetical protein [Actinoplanes sp.]
MSTLISGLVGAAGTVGAVTVGAALIRRRNPYLVAGHALAAPRDVDPLPGVLRLGLGGLTVAVRPGPHGELYLGAGDPEPGCTLRRRVLTPLFELADARGGRLCADQCAPFRLVVEVYGPNRDADTLLHAYRSLDRLLHDHIALLTRCVGDALEPGALTVSLTGIVDVRDLLAARRQRYLFAEGGFDDIGDPAAPAHVVPVISEPWRRRFGWDGVEEIPAEERHLLHALVAGAHADGRTVRFSSVPVVSRRARKAIWDELLAAGVDVIGDADPKALAGMLSAKPSRSVPAPRSVSIR